MLKAPLPDWLDWLTPQMEAVIRPAAYLKADKLLEAQRGGSRTWGLPDLPQDAHWAQFPVRVKHWNSMPWRWGQAPQDGDSFWLQLNLEEIPENARKPEWPSVGVVWVFINLTDEQWRTDVHFDPRSARDIPWQASLDDNPPKAGVWVVQDTAPDCTEHTLPEACWPAAAAELADWAYNTYISRAPSDTQVGGWFWPCQGDFDARNKDLVCGLTRQPFGDSGELYLHYSRENGFYALLETH